MEPFTSFFQARRSGPLRGRQAGQRAAGGGGRGGAVDAPPRRLSFLRACLFCCLPLGTSS